MSDDNWAVPDGVIGRLAEAGRQYSAARPAGLERVEAFAREVRARGFGTISEQSPVIAAALEQAKRAKPAGTARSVSDVVSPMMRALAANNEKSRMISEQMKFAEDKLRKTAAEVDNVAPASLPSWHDMKLVNPSAKTNSLLADLSDEISRVTDLSAKQIDLQNRQVELISQLVTSFAEGSTAQEESLKLARRGTWIAVVAIVIGAAVTILVPIFT